jgi:hypothetical protein
MHLMHHPKTPTLPEMVEKVKDVARLTTRYS